MYIPQETQEKEVEMEMNILGKEITVEVKNMKKVKEKKEIDIDDTMEKIEKLKTNRQMSEISAILSKREKDIRDKLETLKRQREELNAKELILKGMLKGVTESRAIIDGE